MNSIDAPNETWHGLLANSLIYLQLLAVLLPQRFQTPSSKHNQKYERR